MESHGHSVVQAIGRSVRRISNTRFGYLRNFIFELRQPLPSKVGRSSRLLLVFPQLAKQLNRAVKIKLDAGERDLMKLGKNATRCLTLLFMLFIPVITSTKLLAEESVNEKLWIGGVFIPVGFDDNDEVVIALDGFVPNSCYNLNDPVIERTDNVFRISLTARVSVPPCLITSKLPFTKIVTLGLLKEGIYTVEVNDGLTFEELTIEKAPKDTQDTYTYAAVTGAGVRAVDGKMIATLYLKMHMSCIVLDEVKTFDSIRTVELLPIIKLDETISCEPTSDVNVVEVALPESISKGRHLLHVRSQQGQSVNIMFNKN